MLSVLHAPTTSFVTSWTYGNAINMFAEKEKSLPRMLSVGFVSIIRTQQTDIIARSKAALEIASSQKMLSVSLVQLIIDLILINLPVNYQNVGKIRSSRKMLSV